MASNLSTIGFVFANEDDFRAAMVRYSAETSARAECSAGSYGIWQSRTGAEIWFHLSPSTDGTTEICGLTPFFEGLSDVALKITKPVQRGGDGAFEGAFHGWIASAGHELADHDDGSYPLVFEAVDYAMQAHSAWPQTRRVRLCAFAREVLAFADEAAFHAPRGEGRGDSLNLSAKSFVPVGLLAAAASKGDSDGEQPASPSALLTGKVIDHRELENEATGQSFAWILVESLDATFDVIADPEVVTGEITDGGTVEVMATLFGRFLD